MPFFPMKQLLLAVKSNPELLKEIPELWQSCELLKALDIPILSGPFIFEAVDLAQEFQLLATDAVHVAAAKKAGIIHIATNDADFSRVRFLQVWRPDGAP